MGNRGNLVLVYDHGVSLLYGHWLASSLLTLLAKGPVLNDYITHLRVENDGIPLSEDWAEAGAVIDWPRHELAFWVDDVSNPLQCIDHLRTAWPGWHVRWLEGGQSELAWLYKSARG